MELDITARINLQALTDNTAITDDMIRRAALDMVREAIREYVTDERYELAGSVSINLLSVSLEDG